ncbi:hypothetical protein [Rosistilla carotiformis]|uniref:hypothetical protein n=1 Tax=Rosistilla carotiformis TaxID=2528017 RepID=UPI0011A2C878|nr:hypothetical protein [Rosistilla carotiformis]
MGQEVVAIHGEPFGVGFVRAQWPEPVEGLSRVRVSSPQGRLFYPAAEPLTVTVRDPMRLDPAPRELKFGRGKILERLGQVVKAAVTADERQQVTGYEIWFLFQGDRPFDLQISGPAVATIPIVPVAAAADDHQAALQGWWQSYQAQAESEIAGAPMLPVVDAYLLSYLARRLDLPRPAALSRMRLEKPPVAIEMMADSSGLQRIALADVLRGEPHEVSEPFDTLPAAVEVAEIAPMDDDAVPEGIEPIARMVPPECFYLRFGSFANFLWFQKLAQEHDGDVKNMVGRPILDRRGSQRIEELLNVRYTQLADLFGDALIGDVALVGNDFLLDDGPSIGVLMQAKNAFLLSTFLGQDRQATVAQFPDCTLETKTIEGIEVSLLSTPDNRVRSFWVANGDWMFLTSSEHLAARFIAARKARTPLAATAEFQHFREKYPHGEKPAITLFLPRRFLSTLYTPHFQIELQRRCRAAAEMAVLVAARAAASNEGQSLVMADDLIAAGYLPGGFGHRVDRSGLILTDDGVLDSRRGGRQTLLPIDDVAIDKITSAERIWQDQIDRMRTAQPGLLEPVFIQIDRSAADPQSPDRERLTIAVDVVPAMLGKQAWIVDQLGPPTDIGVQFSKTDLISFHANIHSDKLNGSIPPHYLFGGLKDCYPAALAKFESPIDRIFAISTLRGYLAAWPDPGLIDRLPLGLGRGSPVGPNMTRLVGGAYRYQSERVSLLSFDREVLVESIPDLAVLDKQPTRRAHLKIEDLSQTQLGQWVSDTLLDAERRKSQAGCDLLSRLTEQLGIDRETTPLFAEELLGAALQCPLRGEFRCRGDGHWCSTASEVETPPTAAVMRWFRGLQASVDVVDNRLLVDIEVDVQRATR